MLSGFNTNVRYRGVLFHVQTEDSGRANPHVITHLFHGGDILASEKRTYSDRLESQDTDDEVRTLMECQHKAMLKRLKGGHYNNGIEARLGPGVWKDGSETVAVPVAPPRQRNPDTPKDKLARAFGEGVVSKKPLDEVVLDYLVENARKRKRSSK
ncbi:MAG: hypothetical protein V3T33_03540 [Myxococcota bacterium]